MTEEEKEEEFRELVQKLKSTGRLLLFAILFLILAFFTGGFRHFGF